jgi:hypothetical protein
LNTKWTFQKEEEMANWEDKTRGLAQDGFNLAVTGANFVAESFSEDLRLARQGLVATGEGLATAGKGLETVGQMAIDATVSGVKAPENLGSAGGEFKNITPATASYPKLANI